VAYITSGTDNLFEPAIRITHNDGNPSLELNYVSHQIEKPEENVTITHIRLKDNQYPVEVILHYKTFNREDVFVQWVEITHQEAMLGDHYDPIHKRLVLSSENYFGSTPAALGVAAHESGHAIQHQLAYKPLTWRMAAVGITTYASQMVFWVPLLGVFTGLIQPLVAGYILAIAWGVIMLFNLVTLPVEFDASRRAKQLLRSMNMIAPGAEAVAVDKVLNAAAWTYVAAFVTSLAYFLVHLLPLLAGGRQRE
jgi:Zn-dependent membrane protease YugP